jgi:hypothetical protein
MPQPVVRAIAAAHILHMSPESPRLADERLGSNRAVSRHKPSPGVLAPRLLWLQRPAVAMPLALVLAFLTTTLLIGTVRAGAEATPVGTNTIQRDARLTQGPPPGHVPGAHRDVAINRGGSDLPEF